MVQHNDLYKIPSALPPPGGPVSSLNRFYNWPRSQYYHFLNLVDITMEQTSSLINTFQMDASFTRFNELPPELRIKIWQFAMPEPRIVVMKARNIERPASLEEALLQTVDCEKSWQSTTQIPPLLHVNAEARYEALKHYALSFGVGKTEPKVYVDFNRDTLFFGDAELISQHLSLWAKTKDLDNIRRLATVPEGTWRILQWSQSHLDSLKKLIFVHETEKIKLGSLPQLVEDGPLETVPNFELEFRQHRITIHIKQSEIEGKMRAREAREEIDTLMRVLPIQWEKEPAVSSAVFRKSRGDRWVC
ncbi:hypothetical protein GGS21DRAFT_3382 [Xylaria nigripes]|nr:hypothetical protein GGS21DRAFT_3382 [Xylaria nigripes]